jgi:hypothetical protein
MKSLHLVVKRVPYGEDPASCARAIAPSTPALPPESRGTMRLPMSSRFDEFKIKIDSFYRLKSLEAPCHNSLSIILLVHIQPEGVIMPYMSIFLK